MECTFFPETYRRFCHMLDHQHPYIIEGKVEEDYGAFTITVDRVAKLSFDSERRNALAGDRDSQESGHFPESFRA
jgi:DNA polymerase III alpha subunit